MTGHKAATSNCGGSAYYERDRIDWPAFIAEAQGVSLFSRGNAKAIAPRVRAAKVHLEVPFGRNVCNEAGVYQSDLGKLLLRRAMDARVRLAFQEVFASAPVIDWLCLLNEGFCPSADPVRAEMLASWRRLSLLKSDVMVIAAIDGWSDDVSIWRQAVDQRRRMGAVRLLERGLE